MILIRRILPRRPLSASGISSRAQHPTWRWVALVAILALQTGCATSRTARPVGSNTRTPVTPTPAVVFQADWSKGLAGWQASPGWSIKDGALQSDIGDNRTITIPYLPVSGNYAVEYSMQVIDPRDGGECDFLAPHTAGSDGYALRLWNLLARGHVQFALHPQFGMTIDPVGKVGEDPENYGAWGDYEPGPSARVYRLEVSGPTVSLTIDGRRYQSVTSAYTSSLSRGPLAFTCSLASIRISAITISAH